MKILLIKRGAMGDILMTTPLIRQLRNKFPDSVIDYCVAKPFLSTLQSNKYINNITSLEDKVFSSKGVIKYIKFIWSIRNKYDYVFILGKNWQLNLLNRLFKGVTIGYAREYISRALLNKYVIYNDVTRYHGLYYLDLLKASGLAFPDYNDLELDLLISDIDKKIVNNKIKKLDLDLDKFVIVVNSGGNNGYESGNARMLPNSKVVELLKKLLLNTPYSVVLLGGAVDKANYANYIDQLEDDGVFLQLEKANIVNLAGEFTLAQSTYFISKAEHFYVTDCGAMHLGVIAKMGHRMTCFFGPTSPLHVLPPDNTFNVIWNDKAIFDESYPLKGKFVKQKRDFFSNLAIDGLL